MGDAEKLASFIAKTQASVRHIGEGFDDPDDDWMSVAFLEGADETYMIGIGGETFANGHSKDALAAWLQEAMVVMRADRYAVLFNVHGLENPSEQDWEEYHGGKRLSEFPNSYELLILVAGDAEQEVAHQVRINRDGQNPPTLDEWSLVEKLEGRFAGLNARMKRRRS